MASAHSANALAAQGSGQNKAVRYLAHVRQDGKTFIPHDLNEHLRGVAQRAEAYARDFGSRDWAQVVGLWHDLGSLSDRFETIAVVRSYIYA